MEEHPAVKERPSAWVFLWRYFTGHYMDGVKRDRYHQDASWWTRKHRFHRALWRIAIIILPIGWLILVRISPDIRINITVVLTAMLVPYLFHHGTLSITRSIPKTRVVTVREQVMVEAPQIVAVDTDGIVIGEDGTDDLDTALDEAINNVSPLPRERRSSQVRLSRNSVRFDRD